MISAFIGATGAVVAGLVGLLMPIMAYRQKVDIYTLLIIVGISASLFHSAYALVQWGLN